MAPQLKEFPRLYAKASNGKIKFWEVQAFGTGENLDNPAEVRIRYGYVDQDPDLNQHTCRKIPQGKNLGRANQTTPFQQACLEAESLWNKKQDKKYVEDKSGESNLLLPMLAHDYKKRGHNIDWEAGAFVQPKLNGVRCLSTRVGKNTMLYKSRGGKTYETLGHLDDLLLSFLRVGETLDGEIFTQDLTFQEICSAVKGVKTQKVDSTQLQYWFYDIILPDQPFYERLKEMNRRANATLSWPSKKLSELVFTPTHECSSEGKMREYHAGFVDAGFEGTIIRNAKGIYRCDFRSPDLQKYKDFIDAEFKIVGAKEGIGKDEGKVTWICLLPNGNTFDCRPRGTDEERKRWWENREQFFGKKLTVRYQNLSDDGVPIFPVGINIRDYE